MSNTKRQQNIINYIQSKGKVANAEILDFLDNTIERTTLQRDLNLLLKKGLITKSGSGRSTAYSISKINKISLPINIEEYFNTPYYFK
ncbi:MAG: BlaI/MecI/CopY family transcriptional regulator [Patescibacteria group bacterium]|jgi:DeoR/GlpR family transcriptional regulator of sugar metabolism